MSEFYRAECYELAGCPIDVYFLYSNGSTSAHTADRYGFRMKCYYNYTPAGSVSVRESLLMENGPSCIGYRKNGGTLSPVFEKNPLCYAEKYVYEEVHRGAYEFAQELLHHFADWQELFQLRAAEVSAPFEYFLCHAPAFDRALFSCCSMEDEVYAGISGYSLETIWGEDMAERGLLTRLTVKEVTAVVDAARGSAVIVDGAVEPREMPEIPEDIKILPARLKPSEAEGAALAAVSAASPRGWKRGLRHSELFFKHSGEDVSALRLYIIRGPLLIDAFTGESSGAASLIEFII